MNLVSFAWVSLLLIPSLSLAAVSSEGAGGTSITRQLPPPKVMSKQSLDFTANPTDTVVIRSDRTMDSVDRALRESHEEMNQNHRATLIAVKTNAAAPATKPAPIVDPRERAARERASLMFVGPPAPAVLAPAEESAPKATAAAPVSVAPTPPPTLEQPAEPRRGDGGVPTDSIVAQPYTKDATPPVNQRVIVRQDVNRSTVIQSSRPKSFNEESERNSFYFGGGYLGARYSQINNDLRDGANFLSLGIFRGVSGPTRLEVGGVLDVAHGVDQSLAVDSVRMVNASAHIRPMWGSDSAQFGTSLAVGFTSHSVRSVRDSDSGNGKIVTVYTDSRGVFAAPGVLGRLRLGSSPDAPAALLGADYWFVLGGESASSVGGPAGHFGLQFPL